MARTERDILEHQLQMQLVSMCDTDVEILLDSARILRQSTQQHLEEFAAADDSVLMDRAAQIDHLITHGFEHDAVLEMSPKERVARHYAAHGFPWLLAQFTREQAEVDVDQVIEQLRAQNDSLGRKA